MILLGVQLKPGSVKQIGRLPVFMINPMVCFGFVNVLEWCLEPDKVIVLIFIPFLPT